MTTNRPMRSTAVANTIMAASEIQSHIRLNRNARRDGRTVFIKQQPET
jgi:hypothetical protein